jgi:hypothetical protein
MPAKKSKAAPSTSNKRGRPKKAIKKAAPAKAAPKKTKPVADTQSEGNKAH